MAKPGCQWIVAAISILMALGFIFGGSRCNSIMQQAQKESALGPAIATLGDIRITASQVDNAANSQGNPATAKPADVANAYGQAMDEMVTQAELLALAKQNGVDITNDDVLLKIIGQEFDDQNAMMLQMEKKVPQGAGIEDIKKAFKEETKQDYDAAKKDTIDRMKTQIQDPSERNKLVFELANSISMDAIKSKINISDDELLHMNDSLVTKRILLTKAKHKGQDIQKLADQILADLKAKKITFEDAMDKYTDEPAGPGKKPHDNTMQVDMQTATVNPEFSPIKGLRPGELTGVLPVSPDGVAIYRYDSTISSPPPDFQKNKAQLREQAVTTRAAAVQTDQLKKLAGQVKWENTAYQLLWQWYKDMGPASGFASKTPAEKDKIANDYLQKGKDLSKTDVRLGGLIQIGAFQTLYDAATPDKKKQMDAERIQLEEDFLQSGSNESYPARIDLVNYGLEKKDKSLVGDNLVQAALLNNDVQTEGQKRFGDLNALFDKADAAGLLTEDQKKQIQAQFDLWRQSKKEYDDSQNQEKQAAERQQMEEHAKQVEEQLKKNAAKSNPPAPSAGKPATGARPPAPSTPAKGAPPQPATTGKPNGK